MATRSTIAVQYADGSVRSVFCKYDGYIANNGKRLFEHYKSVLKTRELISLGGIYALGNDIGMTHDYNHGFDTPEARQALREKNTTFYIRDIDDSFAHQKDFKIKSYKNETSYKKNLETQEYNYYLDKNGIWWVCKDSACYNDYSDWILLETAIELDKTISDNSEISY